MSRKKPYIWSEENKQYLKEIVEGRHYYEIVALMNNRFGIEFTSDQIKNAINRYKLNTGFNGRYEKGNTPYNKGKKGLIGPNRTSFKKGQLPHNYRPVGSERVNVDGYTEIKIKDPNKWRLKHIVIWEEVNGPLPKGYAVIFGDGDKLNLDISNLILVSRKKLLVLNRNGLIKNDIQLTKTGLIIADVIEKVADRRGEIDGNRSKVCKR